MFTFILFLSMFVIVQLMWVAVQKWQFNHFAAYSSRVWTVQKEDDPDDSLLSVQVRALFRWDLISRDYVKFMWVSASDETREIDDEDYTGIGYTGVAPLMSIFRDQIGETLYDNPVPSEAMSLIPFNLPTTGLVRFESFIPIRKEPEEQPDISNRDNDCEETPCEEGNGRD